MELIFPITLLLLFRLLLRRTGPALVVVSTLGTLLFYPSSGSVAGYLVGMSCFLVIFWVVLLRVGLLAAAAAFTMRALLTEMPLMPQPPAWYLGPMLLALVCIAAPAFYGFWVSQAGRPLFRDEVLEPAVRH